MKYLKSINEFFFFPPEIEQHDRGFISFKGDGNAYRIDDEGYLVNVPIMKDGSIGSADEESQVEVRAFDDNDLESFKDRMNTLFNGQKFKLS